MSHDIVVATHIGGQLAYVVHTNITTARRRISYLMGQIFKLTHPVDHSIFSVYELEKLENKLVKWNKELEKRIQKHKI